jgi:hypothetical protein
VDPDRFTLEDDDPRIVELFAYRRPLYDAATVRRLTGATRERLKAAFDQGHFESVTESGRPRYQWEDVANLALERWTPRQIGRALERAGHADALPPLNQFRPITIELPLYQIRLLHRLAEERSEEGRPSWNVSDVLEYEIAAMAAGQSDMEDRLPGFEIAALFPKLSGAPHLIEQSCLFCGDVVTDDDVCEACARRHVPRGEGSGRSEGT